MARQPERHALRARRSARVVAEFTFSGTHQGPLLGFELTGKRLDLPITGTYVISDQQVVDFDLEYDVQTVLAAIAP